MEKSVFVRFTLVALLAVLVVGTARWVIYKKEQMRKDEEFGKQLQVKTNDLTGSVPNKAVNDYDPSEHKAMFVVRGMDKESKTMRLSYIFPAKWRGNEITSTVTCSRGNTKLYYGSGKPLVPAEKTVYEEERVKPGETIMQAICADPYCRQIRKYCELWVKE